MNLPLKALRSKDFPQDRQTKLQNTLTPLPLPTTHTSSPRFITVHPITVHSITVHPITVHSNFCIIHVAVHSRWVVFSSDGQ